MTAPRTARPSPAPKPAHRADPFDVLEARFLAEARNPDEWPAAGPPELAVAGRSNVGKSSLLNMLCQRNGLARTSRTPGCTRGLVFFELALRQGTRLRFVDLPGYGYAARSQQERRHWGPMLERFLTDRAPLEGVLILFDLRRGPQDEERDLFDFLERHERPILPIATKADAVPRNQRLELLRRYEQSLGQPVLLTSSETREGRSELLRSMVEHLAQRAAHFDAK